MADYREQQAKNGRRGGKKVLKKYGKEHFSAMGKKGAKTLWGK